MVKKNLDVAKNLEPELAKFKTLKAQKEKLAGFDINKIIGSVPGGTLTANAATDKILKQVQIKMGVRKFRPAVHTGGSRL